MGTGLLVSSKGQGANHLFFSKNKYRWFKSPDLNPILCSSPDERRGIIFAACFMAQMMPRTIETKTKAEAKKCVLPVARRLLSQT